MNRRSWLAWLAMIIPLLVITWVALSFLIRPAADPAKTIPSLVGHEEDITPRYFRDGKNHVWTVDGRRQYAMIMIRDHSGRKLFHSDSARKIQPVDADRYPHTRRMMINLFESQITYVEIPDMESLFLLSRNPLNRTRWFTKIQFFKFKQWAMARGWWWNTQPSFELTLPKP